MRYSNPIEPTKLDYIMCSNVWERGDVIVRGKISSGTIQTLTTRNDVFVTAENDGNIKCFFFCMFVKMKIYLLMARSITVPKRDHYA